MAIGPLIGTGGAFLTASPVHNGRIRAWSATADHEVNDVTGFAQQPWRNRIGGLKSLSGAASGYLEKDASSSAPNLTGIASTGATTFTLTAATGCTLTFAGVISQISYGQTVDGVGTVSFNFVSTSTVTETWDEA